jgi:hypothetical protein
MPAPADWGSSVVVSGKDEVPVARPVSPETVEEAFPELGDGHGSGVENQLGFSFLETTL